MPLCSGLGLSNGLQNIGIDQQHAQAANIAAPGSPRINIHAPA
jgi:hypothetical protein